MLSSYRTSPPLSPQWKQSLTDILTFSYSAAKCGEKAIDIGSPQTKTAKQVLIIKEMKNLLSKVDISGPSLVLRRVLPPIELCAQIKIE